MAINFDPDESRLGKMGNWVGSIVSWFSQWVTPGIMMDELSKTDRR